MTVATLKHLNLSVLTRLYNELADKPVKAFRDKDTAAARVAALGETSRMQVVIAPEGAAWQPLPGADPDAPDYEADGAEVDPQEDAEQAKPAKKGKKAKAAPATTLGAHVAANQSKSNNGPEPQIAATAKITVLSPQNPKRPHSASFQRFALYRTGMTVGEYLAAAVALQGGKQGRWRQDLSYDEKHGFIKVS